MSKAWKTTVSHSLYAFDTKTHRYYARLRLLKFILHCQYYFQMHLVSLYNHG